MDTTKVANVVSAIGTIILAAGVSGVTQQDVNGFVNVLVAVITFASIMISHLSHNAQLAAASAPKA
jgi:hypothetical protein